MDNKNVHTFPSPYGEVKLERILVFLLVLAKGKEFPSPYGEVKLERGFCTQLNGGADSVSIPLRGSEVGKVERKSSLFDREFSFHPLTGK